jgi:formylglycine-generating enzyme required for sulfatase activity
MADGRFSVVLALKPGDNTFTLAATDAAGNTETKKASIHWQRWPKGLVATRDPNVAQWPGDGAAMVEVKVGSGVIYVDRDEVTVAQYTRFIEAIAKLAKPQQGRWDHRDQPRLKKKLGHRPKYWSAPFRRPATRPVCGVDWWDAWAYAKWAGKRLPTESEWEAAAGGSRRSYPWGSTPPDAKQAIFGLRGFRARPSPVGGRDAGAAPTGTRDMAGNVWEWCDGRGASRAVRGGGYNSQDPKELKISSRRATPMGTRRASIGFRCAWKP